MRVAIDSGPLVSGHSVRGVGVSVKGLIEALVKYNSDKDIHIDPVDFSSTDLAGYDLIHHTSFNPYFLNKPVSVRSNFRVIYTIHDLIPVIYKEQYPPGVKGSLKYLLNKFLVNKADKIITVSETSKKDIVRFLGVQSEKIEVIYWAHDPLFKKISDKQMLKNVKSKYNLPDKFVLYVGDVNFNKNLSVLINACAEIKTPLVVVGKQLQNLDETTASWKNLTGPKDYLRSLIGKSHPELKHFKDLAELIKRNKVVTTGYVNTDDLVGIYNLASVYCQPSLYEGFGLPILEAFACETPVVISKTQALVEISNGSALIADSGSYLDFARKISLLLKDSSEKLHFIRAGKNRSREFSWEKTALQTIDTYKKLFINNL